ncbi:MAG TPA: TetR/AcrR family transcriptional regulator, partial [Candidatus Acetothermia bacterium]|nr:TetR/AcrR family transcriptional regulator [Candidatus Acetothermia bacterium]
MGVTQRRIREREARVALILDAALRVFTSRGLHDGTMEEIAEEAELGKATLYYYFPSKETILSTLVEKTIERHFDGIRENAQQATNPLEAASAIIRGFAANYERTPDLFRLFYMALISKTEDVAPAVRAFGRYRREWRKSLREDVRDALKGTGISPEILVSFTGTHVHGINLL